jgi:ABC-type branched-subunit amino acid transport system ATPase component
LARSKDEMMLEVKDIHVSYNGLQALKGISLYVEEASIVTITENCMWWE